MRPVTAPRILLLMNCCLRGHARRYSTTIERKKHAFLTTAGDKPGRVVCGPSSVGGAVSTKFCRAHGGEYRSQGRRAILLVNGKHEAAIVCPDCHSKGVTVVATFVAPVVRAQVARDDGVDKALRILRGYRESYRRTEHPGHLGALQFWEGRLEGIETAIAVLEKVQKGEA